jgi:tape measure domain-containing protein
LTIRDIAIAFGYEEDTASRKKVEDSIQSLKSTATKLLGAIAVGFSLVKLKDLSEEFGNINNQIRDATRGMGDQRDIQQSILKSANNARMSYASMADSVSKLAQNKEVFSGVEDAANFAELMAKNFRAAGKSESETTSMMQSITNSMSRGVVDSRAMMNILRESPSTFRMIADSLGVSTDALQDMAAKGQVTAQTLKAVFEANAGNIDDRFGQLDMSITDGLRNIRNQWGLFVAETDEMLGLTKTIARVMVNAFNRVLAVLRKMRDFVQRVGDRMGGVDRMMKLIAISAAAIFVALNAGKIMTFLKAAGMALKKISLKMIAIVAVIVIVALVIEDLINFMQGNDSLLGELFNKFGIDGDAVREFLNEVFDIVKGLLPFLIEVAKLIGGMLLDGIKQILPLLMDLLKKLLPPIISFVRRLIPMLVEIGKKIIPLITGVIERLLPFLISIIEQILPFIIGLIERLLPFLFQIIEAILPVIFSLIEAILPLLFTIIDAILPIVISLIDMLLPLVFQIIDIILPVIISLIEMILPLVFQIIDAVLPIIIMLLETLLPFLFQIIETILPIIFAIIEAILPLLFEIIQAVLPVVLALIEAILPILIPIIDLVMSLVSALLPPIITLLNAILPILTPILSILKPIADVLGVVIGLISKVVGWVTKGFSWVIGLFTGGNKGGDVEVDSSGNPVQGHAKGTNRIRDDTVLVGEEGPELISGGKGKKVFNNAETGNVFKTLADIASMAIAPKPETVAAAQSSIENKAITQNISITNQFQGDRAGQQKSAEAMDKAADDSVEELAHALAYLRG